MKFFKILSGQPQVLNPSLQGRFFLGCFSQVVHAEINGGKDEGAEKKTDGYFVISRGKELLQQTAVAEDDGIKDGL